MRKPSARVVNAALAAALALVLLGGGAVLAGQGWARIEGYQAQLRERLLRAEVWAFERSVFRDPSAEQRALRLERWADLQRRVEVVDGPAALIAHVAEQLQAPSVRALEVERRSSRAYTEADEASAATHIHAPEGDASVALVSVPLEVSFRASYADALALLDRIERRQLAVRLDSLDIKREHPGVVIHLGLTWFTRNPPEDAG